MMSCTPERSSVTTMRATRQAAPLTALKPARAVPGVHSPRHLGHSAAFGFLRWIWPTNPFLARKLVGRRLVGSIGPHYAVFVLSPTVSTQHFPYGSAS
jgi:hypothetical protein